MPVLDEPARAAIRGCRLFAGLDDDGIDLLTGAIRRRRYRRGEVIFHQDDPGDGLFVVVAGAVKIEVPSADGDTAAIIATVRPCESFGELALLDGAPRSADAVALEPSDLLVVGREAFIRLVDEDRHLRHALMAALAGELRRLTGHVSDLHFLDLPGRVATQLLRLADGVPPGPDGSIRLAFPYTQAELAGMVGGSRQSVNRLLADLERRGIVSIERDEIVLRDPDLLAAEAAR